MADRPGIVLVDDDPDVVSAVERDMRRRYSASYRVMALTSGAEAIQAVDRLTVRGDEVAMVVADQRMPSMTGTQLLAEVGRRHPTTKRVLLTAYADTEAAIEAINAAAVDYYILKPWDPPDERLYPVVDDLLGDCSWAATRSRSDGWKWVSRRRPRS